MTDEVRRHSGLETEGILLTGEELCPRLRLVPRAAERARRLSRHTERRV